MKKTLLFVLTALGLAACSGPSPCECAENMKKALTGGMDQNLAYECADHQNSLSSREKMEYMQEMMKCDAMKFK